MKYRVSEEVAYLKVIFAVLIQSFECVPDNFKTITQTFVFIASISESKFVFANILNIFFVLVVVRNANISQACYEL